MKNNAISLHQLVPLILGIVATLLIMLPALVLSNSESAFSGFEVAFGHEFVSLGTWASGEIAFNLLVVFAFALPLIAGIVPLVSKNGHLISAMLFALAAILLFMIPSLTTVNVTLGSIITEIEIEWTLGIGVIVAASVSILSSLLSVIASSHQQ